MGKETVDSFEAQCICLPILKSKLMVKELVIFQK